MRQSTLWLVLAMGLLAAGCNSDDSDDDTTPITIFDSGASDVGDTSATPDGQSADGQSADGQSADGQSADGQSADGQSADTTTDDGGDDQDGQTQSCGSSPCQSDQVCVDGQCVAETTQTKCQAAQDLGTLSPGTPLSASGNFESATDALAASCNDQADASEVVYRFETAEDSRINFDVTRTSGNFAWVVDLRTGCADAATSIQCGSSDSAVGFVAAGTQVYMTIEMAQGAPGEFTVDLSATAQSCATGQTSCTDGQLQVCQGAGQPQSFACADECASTADGCGGDACAEPISVGQTQTFSGDLAAYSNDFDFDGIAGCTNENGTNIPTPGPDVVFELAELTTSDTVTIDAATDDTNLNRLFVVSDTCGQPTECAAVGGDEELFEFTPPQDGTYYVVVDKSLSSAGTFNYSITYE